MSADELRRAAALMRERAEAATDGVCPEWTRSAVRHIARNCDIECWHEDGDPWAEKYHGENDVYGWDRYADATHIASWHPAVALAVADWLDSVALVHWPKRHDRRSESHYNAEPEHDEWDGDCDETCWTKAYICNGCGTAACKPEISERALTVARAYIGEQP